MRMLFLAVIILALAGCQGVNSTDAGPVDDVVLQATPEAIQASPAPSVTPSTAPIPTVAGTPTTDYQAKIGQAALELQLSLGTVTMAAVTQQVIDTAQAKLDVAKQKTGTSTAAVGQTAEAYAVATDDRRATQTLEAPLIEREQVRTQWEPFIQGTFCSGIVLIILALVWAISVIAKAKYIALVPGSVHGDQSQGGLLKVHLDNRDGYGWGSVDWSTLPIDRETLRAVAELIILQGARYTQAQMTGAGNPLVKDGSFDGFGAWMHLNKIAIRMHDGRYVIQRREFFEQVLR